MSYGMGGGESTKTAAGRRLRHSLTAVSARACARSGQYLWAGLDQGMFSFANFIMNVFLARALSPSEYGVFAVGQSLFLFIVGFQNALIIEPMSVLGAHKYATRQNSY